MSVDFIQIPTHEKAVEMILAGECGVFNPVLLECFMEIEGTLEEDLSGGYNPGNDADVRGSNFASDR